MGNPDDPENAANQEQSLNITLDSIPKSSPALDLLSDSGRIIKLDEILQAEDLSLDISGLTSGSNIHISLENELLNYSCKVNPGGGDEDFILDDGIPESVLESTNRNNNFSIKEKGSDDTTAIADDEAHDSRVSPKYKSNKTSPIVDDAARDNSESDSDDENSVDADYVPSEYADSDESFRSSDEEQIKSTEINPVNSICDSSEYSLHTSFNVPGNSACDDREQIAELSRGAKGGQKKNFCFYCKKMQSKIARHLESKHPDQEEVKKFLSLPKKSVERKQIIAIVRKKGNFLYNVNEEWNQGKLIPVRRPKKRENRSGQNFVACPRCRGFYSKNNIRHHHRVCTKKKDNSRHVLANARKTTGRIHESASLILRREVFPILRDDNISRLIRYDKLIILYGNRLCRKLRLRHQHDEIRAHLRRLGRFLEVIKQVNLNITDMTSVFDPKHYNAVIEAVNIIAQLDPKTQLYKIPSVAAAIGTALKKLGHILETECIKDHNSEKKKNTKDFLKLLSEDYTYSVNKGVSETMANVQRTKKINLPKTEDIRSLDDYLDRIIDKESANLRENFNADSWKSLAEATLIKLQLFNRRRAGEIERLSIEEFENRQSINEDDELYQKLTKQDKVSAKKYVRIAIRGKLNRTVPVLMSTKMLDNVQLLLKHRKAARVSSKNEFVFGIESADKSRSSYLRACVLLRKFSDECGAKNPLSLRGTNLRKHIATRCADMDLSDNQISRVANFMGHHENIHRNIYRQPVVKVDILDMSRVLEKAQGLNASESSQHNTTGCNSTNEEHGVTDSSGLNSTVNDSHNACAGPETSIDEVTPASKKRKRFDSELSLDETLEGPVPASKKRKRFDSELSLDETLEGPVPAKSSVLHNRKKNRKDEKMSPEAAPTMSLTARRVSKFSVRSRSSPESTPEAARPLRVTRSNGKENTSPSSPETVPKNTAPKKIKKGKKILKENSPTGLPTTSAGKKPRWSKTEVQQALECFSSYLEADTLPGLKIIEKAQKDRNYLSGRSAAVIKTWLSNQLRVVRNGGTPQYASTSISKSIVKHVDFIFEDVIANEKLPTVKQCEEVRQSDKKLQHLSATQIRNIVKERINA